jgi:hypothetical protein
VSCFAVRCFLHASPPSQSAQPRLTVEVSKYEHRRALRCVRTSASGDVGRVEVVVADLGLDARVNGAVPNHPVSVLLLHGIARKEMLDDESPGLGGIVRST